MSLYARNLQIGDWIRNDNIIFDEKNYKVYDYFFPQTKEYDLEDIGIHPIYISSDILDKNGFSSSECNNKEIGECLLFKGYDGLVNIYWRGSEESMTSAGTEYTIPCAWIVEMSGENGDVCLRGNVIYVHQIQQAMRLCGLSELAGKFVV